MVATKKQFQEKTPASAHRRGVVVLGLVAFSSSITATMTAALPRKRNPHISLPPPPPPLRAAPPKIEPPKEEKFQKEDTKSARKGAGTSSCAIATSIQVMMLPDCVAMEAEAAMELRLRRSGSKFGFYAGQVKSASLMCCEPIKKPGAP